MNTREMVSRINGSSRYEEEAQNFNKGLDVVKVGVGISWFAALGRFWDAITGFFSAHAAHFFAFSVLLSFISWVASIVEFHSAANRNLGKIANLAYSTLYFGFYFATGAVLLLVGMHAGGMLLFTSMFIDPLVNLGRAIYFGVKSLLESDTEKKYYFKNRALTHGAFAITGTVISVAFVVLMILAAMPLGWAIALGVLGIGIMVGAAFVIPKIVAKLMGPAPQPRVEGSDLIVMDLDDSAEEALLRESKPRHYYDYTVTKLPASLDQLREKTGQHIRTLEQEYTRDEGTVRGWFENPKRRNKMDASEYLKKLINFFEGREVPETAQENAPFYIPLQEVTGEVKQHPLHYTDKIHLCDQIKKLVTDEKRFTEAFQSTGLETGATEDYFNKLLLCIMTNSRLLYKKDITNETDENELISNKTRLRFNAF